MSYCEVKWLDVLLSGYGKWIKDMERLKNSNTLALTATQVFLGLGIAFLVVGFAVGPAAR